MKEKQFSRRQFLGNGVTAAGMMALGTQGISAAPFGVGSNSSGKLPREVWIASFSQMGLTAETPEEMAKLTCDILEKVAIYKPDVICLPEVFMFSNVKKKLDLAGKVETSEKLLKVFSGFADKHNCHVICPAYTAESGKVYNSAVVLGRSGEYIGEYRKIHPTEGEISRGITPGPLDPPVFKTDFGTIGIQICFDILWDDPWKALRQKGAEIVFFTAAYAGGQAVNARAWQNKYVVVSSTTKNTSKICDISGEEIAKTGPWDINLVCAPVNLEKAFLHVWPYVRRFDEIRAKYGRSVRITNFHEEEWSIIESLSPDISVKSILEEFDLKTHEEHTRSAEAVQDRARNSS
jgi:beta-ureidopropionase